MQNLTGLQQANNKFFGFLHAKFSLKEMIIETKFIFKP